MPRPLTCSRLDACHVRRGLGVALAKRELDRAREDLEIAARLSQKVGSLMEFILGRDMHGLQHPEILCEASVDHAQALRNHRLGGGVFLVTRESPFARRGLWRYFSRPAILVGAGEHGPLRILRQAEHDSQMTRAQVLPTRRCSDARTARTARRSGTTRPRSAAFQRDG